MKEYFVSMDCIYSTTVFDGNEKEAIDIAINECPYDVDPSCEPYAEEQKEDEKL